MAETVAVKNIGLRGVIVADTAVSFIDGQEGILIYRGYRIEELAESSSFIETAYLLLNGRLPSKQELDEFDPTVRQARNIPDWLNQALRKLPKRADPMDVLQGSVPLLAMDDPDLHEQSREANVRMAARLIARVPAVTAAWHRIRQDKEPLHRTINLLTQQISSGKSPEISRMKRWPMIWTRASYCTRTIRSTPRLLLAEKYVQHVLICMRQWQPG